MHAASTPSLAEVRWRGRHFLPGFSAREEHTAGPGVRKCAAHAVGVWRVKQTDQQEVGPGAARLRAVRGGGDLGTVEERESTETGGTGAGTISELEGGMAKLGIREQAGKGVSPRAARETWGDAKFRENMRRAFSSRQGLGPVPYHARFFD
jgi:hypothetical protein